VDGTIHRLGNTTSAGKFNGQLGAVHSSGFDAEALITAVEKVCGLAREEFCGRGKDARLVSVKEALILVGTRTGASNRMLCELVGLSSSTVSRRYDSAYRRLQAGENRRLTDQVEKFYWESRT
jgi:uncharacterized ferredoxin-like protein